MKFDSQTLQNASMVKNVILIFILGLFPSIKEYIKVLEKIYVNQRAYVDLNQQG
jgi:hypothetical protein